MDDVASNGEGSVRLPTKSIEPAPSVSNASKHKPILDRVLGEAARIRAVVAAHGGSNPRLFGSVARREDSEASDLDIVVDHRPCLSLLGMNRIQEELEQLLGVNVDLLIDDTIPDPERKAIDAQAITL